VCQGNLCLSQPAWAPKHGPEGDTNKKHGGEGGRTSWPGLEGGWGDATQLCTSPHRQKGNAKNEERGKPGITDSNGVQGWAKLCEGHGRGGKGRRETAGGDTQGPPGAKGVVTPTRLDLTKDKRPQKKKKGLEPSAGQMRKKNCKKSKKTRKSGHPEKWKNRKQGLNSGALGKDSRGFPYCSTALHTHPTGGPPQPPEQNGEKVKSSQPHPKNCEKARHPTGGWGGVGGVCGQEKKRWGTGKLWGRNVMGESHS